jgi:hypothetical protein
MIMGVVRSHRRWGAWAGLTALLLQLVLSFGHMHRDDLGLPPLGAADHAQIVASQIAASQVVARNVVAGEVVAGTVAAPAGQSQHDQQPLPDDYCPICASMVLVATAMASSPPAFVAPIPVRDDWLSHAAIRGAPPKFVTSFQARGPPSI